MGDRKIWKAIWTKRRALSREYAVDLRLASVLSECGGMFSDHEITGFINKASLSLEDGEASFYRLFWSGVVKVVRYNPLGVSTYRLTRRHVRMPPLHNGGNTFRPPLRRDGKQWGPRFPLDEDAIPPSEPLRLSDADALAIFARIEEIVPKRIRGDARAEVSHDILADVLAGKLDPERIESALAGYIARAGKTEDRASPFGTTELNDWSV